MKRKKYLDVLQEIVSNENVDVSFIDALNGVVLKAKNNPKLSVDLAYKLNNILNFYEIKKTFSEEKTVEYITRDWSSFLYGCRTFNSAFGSYDPLELKKYGYLHTFGNKFGQIYKDTQGNIHLKYQPKSIIKEIDNHSRGADKWHYIEFVISSDDISKIKIDEDTEFKTENGSTIMEEIIKSNNHYNVVTNLPKVMIPTSNCEIEIDSYDIEFVKILIDFINNNDISRKSLLNITDNGNLLNVNDIIYIYNVFLKAGFDNIVLNQFEMKQYECMYPTPMKVQTPKTSRKMQEISWIEGIDDIDYVNAIMINSSDLFLDKDYALNLDVSNLFCTNKNIDELINFMNKNNISKYINKLNKLKMKIKTKKR